MPKSVLISFGTPEYEGSLAALRHSALNAGEFDEVIIFSKKDIQWLMDTYPAHFENSRGYGWWAWKPFLIRNVMSQRPDNDIIVYADSTMMFERSIKPYVHHVMTENPIVLFRLGNWYTKENDYRNRKWTKKSVFNRLVAGDIVGQSIQLNAAMQIYKNCPEARAFVDEYLNYCLELDVINDAGKEHDDVFDTRHDQSILSILASEHPKITISRDITQWGILDPPCAVVQPVGGAVEIDEIDENGKMKSLVNHHRRLLKLPKIAVITPTTGGRFLKKCVWSVQNSTLPNVEHWIVVDGAEHEHKVDIALKSFENRHVVRKIVLPVNVGSNGWNGHRVYGSIPWVVDAKYVSFLDDDNTVTRTHFKDLVTSIVTDKHAEWAFCLRYLMNEEDEIVGYDNCESLGGIMHTANGRGDYLIDTSCYMVERDLALSVSHVWNARFRDPDGRPEPDRELCKTLLTMASHATVRKHSVGYRLGSTSISVKPEFFNQGNSMFGYDFAKCDDIYIFHFSSNATAAYLANRKDKTRSHVLDEWQMTLMNGLDSVHGKGFNLIDGFSNYPNIPTGAVVLVNMCNTNDIPMDFFKTRKDLHRIVYTLESPNFRHQSQWSKMFLKECFDVVLTYWKPLIDDPDVVTVKTLHNTHHGDMSDILDRKMLLRTNIGGGRSACMVLERRPELFGMRGYAINNVRMNCQDYMRDELIRGLNDVMVFGINWADIADGTKIKLGHSKHRNDDDRHSVDIKTNFTFDIIVENCDAEGYVSEKFYDALSAGCIPLYWGNVYEELNAVAPEGPGGMYVDLKKRGIKTGHQLQEFLDLLGDTEILEMKRVIVEKRENVLKLVDVNAFAKSVEEAIRVSLEDKKTLQ